MTNRHLNYFEPYRDKRGKHEDQLTRAFLVTLRLVPFALAEFLDLIRDRQRELGYKNPVPRYSELKAEPRIDSQTSRLHKEEGWLVSMLMTDEHFEPKKEVDRRGSAARYDGIVELDEHIVIIENKPRAKNVWQAQLNPDLPERSLLQFEKRKAVVLAWSDVIGRLMALKERGAIGVTGGHLIGDFFQYVERHFRYLNPYSTYAVCRDSDYRLRRRSGQILKSIVNEELVDAFPSGRSFIQIPGHVCARRVFLCPVQRDGGLAGIELAIHPADLVSQAKLFYSSFDRSRLMSLAETPRWQVTPNLHLSFRGTHLVYSHANVEIGTYVDYWKKNRKLMGRASGIEKMNGRIARLQEDGQLDDSDVRDYRQKFIEKRGQFVDVIPGVSLRYVWPLTEAVEFDNSGRFPGVVRQKIEQAFALWGQSLP